MGTRPQGAGCDIGAFEVDTLAGILVTGAGGGGGPEARVFDAATGAEQVSVFAFDPGFRGGVRVAAGAITGTGLADLIVGAGPGGGPEVRILDGMMGQPIAGQLGSFMAFDPRFRGGVFVAAGRCDGTSRVIVGADMGGGPQVKVFRRRDRRGPSELLRL